MRLERAAPHSIQKAFEKTVNRQRTLPFSSLKPKQFGRNVSEYSPAFMTKFEEDALRAHLQKRAKSRKNKKRNFKIDENNLFFIQRYLDSRRLIEDRLNNGYRRHGYKELSGFQIGPVHEEGLRSKTLNSKAAKLFTACVPKAKDLRSNWGKGVLEYIKQKLFSLDEPYIEGNRKFLGFIRIDTDRVWRSEGECRSFYRLLAKDGKIACEPHFLVGLKLPDGRFVRPHAIWMLPYGSAVWNEQNKKGFRRGPLNLFNSVYFGLCNALLEAGADGGAPSCSQQVKNPLSPEWYTVCAQDIHYPDLMEHSEYLELNHTRNKLLRRAACYQSNLGVVVSNELFNVLQKKAYTLLSEWHFSSDDEFHNARSEQKTGLIIDRLHSVLEQCYLSSEVKLKKNQLRLVPLIIAKVAEYAANSWSPDTLQGNKKNRGALMHVVGGMDSLRERQAASAHHASQKNSERARNAIAAAYKRLLVKGGTITKTLVATESGISRATVIKYWQAILTSPEVLECQKRCNDKKHPPSTFINNTNEDIPLMVPIHVMEAPQNDNHPAGKMRLRLTALHQTEELYLSCYDVREADKNMNATNNNTSNYDGERTQLEQQVKQIA